MSDTQTRASVSGIVGNAVLAAVGGAALAGGLGFGVTTEAGLIGPGFLPSVAGALVLVFSLVEIVRLYAARPAAAAPSPSEASSAVAEEAQGTVGDPPADGSKALDTFGRTARQQTTAVWKVFGTIGAAVLLVPLLGMIPALGLLVLALGLWVERRPVVPVVLTSVGAMVFAYIVFVRVLHVPVPTGPLGFV
ncbi:tripartite tricarboxylate transporter TctB family protein [Zhihengliuella sp.]|uniref:tripartite tricarboxylate transporter TctB family protein n=1 Tax=Zhihengliuella sp. TaxID=1954483 RepID=UPI0028122EBB|nr:tripartite tricarboxylate transporter TctB family protein [Zhihengliuella sp.]